MQFSNPISQVLVINYLGKIPIAHCYIEMHIVIVCLVSFDNSVIRRRK